MKKITSLIIILLLIGWGVFQLVATPWGHLTGKLIFNTNRIQANGHMVTVIRQNGTVNPTIKEEGFYGYRWSSDGSRIVAFSGIKTEVVLLSMDGKILSRIGMPEKILGLGLQWLSNDAQVLAVEKSGSIWDASLPVHLTIYDFSTGKRIPFYDKDKFSIMDIAVTKKDGDIFFTGNPAGKEHLGKGVTLYHMNPTTKKITPLIKGPRLIQVIDHDKKVVFYGSLRIFGKLISPFVIGVYDLKTGWIRYISFCAGDIRQMTVVEDGKYLVTAEGEGEAVVLYKRSLLGGFKRPIMKPENLPHLNGFPSQDQYPDWHA